MVSLVDHNASDLHVLKAARVSYGKDTNLEGTEQLIGFLIREGHGSPFEHTLFTFHVRAPIFVAREWVRHRIGTAWNELSGRYVQLSKDCFVPDSWRVQTGKPGQYTYEPLDEFKTPEATQILLKGYGGALLAYRELLDMGVAKEQARMVLPLGLYTRWYWTCNARSLMKFVSLRTDPSAQEEIRDYAKQIEQHLEAKMPATYKMFVKYGRKAP